MRVPVNIRVMAYLANYDYTEKYQAKMAYECKITYSHLSKVISKIEDLKLIRKERDGRKLLLRLTKKGEEIAEHCKEMQKFTEMFN